MPITSLKKFRLEIHRQNNLHNHTQKKLKQN